MDYEKHSPFGDLVRLSIFIGLAFFGAVPGVQAQNSVFIEKKPTKDLRNYLSEQIASKAIDLSAPYDVELTGTLENSGKLRSDSLKYTRSDGNKAMVEVTKRVVGSLSEAGYFQYLRDMSAGEIRMFAKQDDTDFAAEVSFDVNGEARARSIVSGLEMMVRVARTRRGQPRAGRISDDEMVLLEALRFSAASSLVRIQLRLPKQTFRGLAERTISK